MNILYIISLFAGLLFAESIGPNSSIMVEICDNGIDDDMDGLIDINDNDCDCAKVFPAGLIPNPSFEERSCCPTEKARLDCADGWVQASRATTDYVNTCGFLGNVINAPLPIADGDGAIGLRDGSTNDGNYKEYAGACLSQPITANKAYRLQLSIGFTNPSTSPPLALTIFGHTSCAALPFGNNNQSIGCPSNVSGWIEIGNVSVSGMDEWVETEINFSTFQDINTVAIGPDCALRDRSVDRYYFLDNLRLAEAIDFGYDIIEALGNPCLSEYILSTSGTETGESYQWYRNGIAIPSATNPTYSVPDNPNRSGEYQVLISDASGCQLTEKYVVTIASGMYNQVEFACANSTYILGSQALTSSGIYSETFITSEGCDSVVTLDLIFKEANTHTIDTTICDGENYVFGEVPITEAGEYTLGLIDSHGCDSIVSLSLSVREPVAYFNFRDKSINLGEEVELDITDQGPLLQSFIWNTPTGDICPDCINQTLIPVSSTHYAIEALDVSNCIIQDSFNVYVISDYRVYIPNVFSPNGDGNNDRFTIYLNNPTSSYIKSCRIFDRWGNLLYEATDTQEISWNGIFRGKHLNIGTYVYVVEIAFIDGHIQNTYGSVQILR